MNRLSISNALVTGANRGLGLEITRRLLALDCRVLATVRSAEAAAQLQAELGEPAQLFTVIGDVTAAEHRQHFIAEAQRHFQQLDCLINNAGVAPDLFLPSEQATAAMFRQTWEVNVIAAFEMIQAVLPSMKARGFGRIVNLSSEMGSIEQKRIGTSVAYSSSKAALNCMTKIISNELAADYPDILINAAAPGWCKTDMGGAQAPLSAEQGADTPVWLATLPAGGPSGGFFQDRKPLPW